MRHYLHVLNKTIALVRSDDVMHTRIGTTIVDDVNGKATIETAEGC
jgi:hypothetical protein